LTVKPFRSKVGTVSTNRVPNTSHLPGHLRAEYPAAAGCTVQVRNVERPRRRFLVGLTDGVAWSPLGERGGYTTADKAREVASSFVAKVA